MNVIIIGAGLAGLATAYRLNQQGIDVQILEANTRAGGRIQPAIPNAHQDLGPTWVWPYAQPVVAQWLDELKLETFEQYDTGAGLIDSDSQHPAKQQNLPSQFGIARIRGGTHSLIDRIASLTPTPVKLSHCVKRCAYENNQWYLSVATPDDESVVITTDKLIVAIPPRLAVSMFETTDESLNKTLAVLDSTETWMAPHAKVVMVYEAAFWRELGLSGRIASQVGPLVEVHDHSGPEGTPAALFGFAGVPAKVRQDNKAQFIEAIEQQLKRCFGEQAPEPTEILVKDWAYEQYTSTQADRNGNGVHPQVLPNIVRRAHCDSSLWFAVSEVSQTSPGLIEGALARADQIAVEVAQGS